MISDIETNNAASLVLKNSVYKNNGIRYETHTHTMTGYAPAEHKNTDPPQYIPSNPFAPLEMNIQNLTINQPFNRDSFGSSINRDSFGSSINRDSLLSNMDHQLTQMDTSHNASPPTPPLGVKHHSGLMLTGSSSSGISSNDGGSPKLLKKQFNNKSSHSYHQPKCNLNSTPIFENITNTQVFSSTPFKTKQPTSYHLHKNSDSSSGNEKDQCLTSSQMNTLEATESLNLVSSCNEIDLHQVLPDCEAPCHHKCKIGVTCDRHGAKIANKAKRRAEKEARLKLKQDPNRPPPIKSVVPPPVPKNQQNGYATLKDLNFIDPVSVFPGTSKTQFFKKYKIFNVIGIGGGGTVYAGSRGEDTLPIAIKRVMRAKVKRWEKTRDGRSVPQEIALMMRCNGHIGVVQLFDWYETVESFLLILERPESSIDLFDFIRENGPLNEDIARHILTQVIAAIRHLHACGMVHRDIKDENVVLDRHTGVVKLIDFGCGTNLKDGPYTEFSGTAEFYPPEWFNQRRYWAASATVWSLGVLLFDMLQGEIPFKNSDRIIENRPLFKEPVSNSSRNLLRWMLANDYRKRPNLNQVLDHEWMKAVCYTPITSF